MSQLRVGLRAAGRARAKRVGQGIGGILACGKLFPQKQRGFPQMDARIRQLMEAFVTVSPIFFQKRFAVTSTDRTCARQLEISGPNSFHVSGLAFDGLVQPYDPESQRILGAVAKQLGFRWGGDFVTADVVHFDDGLRGAPGRCVTSSSSLFGGDLNTILTIIGGIIQSQGKCFSPSAGGCGPTGNAYLPDQTGGFEVDTRETICAPETIFDGYPRLTGRVTCEPFTF